VPQRRDTSSILGWATTFSRLDPLRGARLKF
jgi:hypothetical protein